MRKEIIKFIRFEGFVFKRIDENLSSIPEFGRFWTYRFIFRLDLNYCLFKLDYSNNKYECDARQNFTHSRYHF